MATLYDTTEKVKKFAKWASIIIGILTILILLFNGANFLKELIAPTPPPPPTVTFGKLPQIEFPQQVSRKTYSYTINTVSGSLPTFSDRMTIYKLVNPEPSLTSLGIAKNILRSINFVNEPLALSETKYQWIDSDSSPRVMVYNIVTNDFSLSSSYLSDPIVLSQNGLPTAEEAQTKAQEFLQQIQSLPEDVDPTKTKTQLLRINNTTLIPADSLTTTHVIRVDFFQKNIEKLPIYYSYPPGSTMYILIAADGYSGKVVDAQFVHHTISNKSATYPIYTAEEAYKLLQKGYGYIARHTGNEKNISITNVSLGYYLGEDFENYLMPIIVFEGNNDFIAYVPAIRDTWVQK